MKSEVIFNVGVTSSNTKLKQMYASNHKLPFVLACKSEIQGGGGVRGTFTSPSLQLIARNYKIKYKPLQVPEINQQQSTNGTNE